MIKDDFKLGDHVLHIELNGQPHTIQVSILDESVHISDEMHFLVVQNGCDRKCHHDLFGY